MPALRQTGPLTRECVFTYFPHSLFGNPPGVSVRSGDWKLIRWYETNEGHPSARELYNLKDDIGETKNLASQEPDKVKQLDALIDGFLATGDVVPIPNPVYRPNSADALSKMKSVDPMQGWKAQNCKATFTNGVLHIEAAGQAPFLGITNLKCPGPVMLRLSARSAGGKVKVQWRTSEEKTFTAGRGTEFDLSASKDGTEAGVELPVTGSLLHLRLYLPAQTKPLDLCWVELRPGCMDARTLRWDFSSHVELSLERP
jgi:hypothetical protein